MHAGVDGVPRLSVPAQVIRTFGLLPEEAVEELEALGLRVSAAAAAIEHEDDLYADAPEDFIDPLTSAVMEDPMTLPNTGVTLDRTSIMRHLLSSQTDPFSRRGCTQRAPSPGTQCSHALRGGSMDLCQTRYVKSMLPHSVAHSTQQVFA